jgi:hypothetical protein
VFKPEFLLVPMSTRGAESLPQISSGNQQLKPLGQKLMIVAGHEETGDAFAYCFWYAANCGRDHRQARAHCLQNTPRQSLPVARQDEDVGSLQEGAGITALSQEQDSVGKG